MSQRKHFTEVKRSGDLNLGFKSSRSSAATLFILLSFAGLILVATLTQLLPPTGVSDPWRRSLVGASFAAVCASGILAGAFPSRCSRLFHFKKERRKATSRDIDSALGESIVFRGHHPDCGHFSTHVIHVGDWAFCAGCVGLMLGAGLSLLGVFTFFFLGQPTSPNHPVLFWVGFIGVALGLLQYHVFSWGGSFLHLVVNAYFVFGVFLLLAGIEGRTQNVTIEAYLIVLSVFWIFTRVLLSQLDHKKTCTVCSLENCEVFMKKRRG